VHAPAASPVLPVLFAVRARVSPARCRAAPARAGVIPKVALARPRHALRAGCHHDRAGGRAEHAVRGQARAGRRSRRVRQTPARVHEFRRRCWCSSSPAPASRRPGARAMQTRAAAASRVALARNRCRETGTVKKVMAGHEVASKANKRRNMIPYSREAVPSVVPRFGGY
jgi:hypothetical protein